MAHSDALIFLTNITWIFFLFLFTYFFFVLFFLPTLYKKFRIRVLLKSATYLGALLATRQVFVTLIFFVESFKNFSYLATIFLKKLSGFFKSSFSSLTIPTYLTKAENERLNSFSALSKYKFNLITTDLPSNGGVIFTIYKKI